MAGKPLTKEEIDRMKILFPDCDTNQCRKLGEASLSYNCIAWSIGVTWDRYNPPNPLAAFIEWYRQKGYEICEASEAVIAGWALPDGKMTHASRLDGGMWTSKLGNWILISHPRDGLRGSNYGNIVVWLKNAPFLAATSPPERPLDRRTSGAQTSEGRAESLAERLRWKFVKLARSFDINWAAGQDITSVTSDSSDYTQGRGWDQLLRMGPSILPFVVDKLHSESFARATEIYHVIQQDSTRKLTDSERRETSSLNAQAQRCESLYESQLQEFERIKAEWAQQQLAKIISSEQKDFTDNCPAFVQLCALGEPAIPLIMDSYTEDKYGWWHEALYRIVHGEPSGANEHAKALLYTEWVAWFES